MRATKLLSVSVTLWAVVVGADRRERWRSRLLPPIRPTTMATPPLPNITLAR